jgi:cobalamin biosynthesis Mg chelatase CobN
MRIGLSVLPAENNLLAMDRQRIVARLTMECTTRRQVRWMHPVGLAVFFAILFVMMAPTARAVDFECGTYSAGEYNESEQCDSLRPTTPSDDTSVSTSDATTTNDDDTSSNSSTPSTNTDDASLRPKKLTATNANTTSETTKSPTENTANLFNIWSVVAVVVVILIVITFISIKRRSG